jgi:hypothetical protein
MTRFLAACLAFAALVPILSLGEAETTMDAGTVIQNVIAGMNYSGNDMIVRGIAFPATGDDRKLVNVGSPQAYESGNFAHYISVYGAGIHVEKGTPVTLEIHIDRSFGAKVGEDTFVIIESKLLKCISCKK